MLIIPCFVCILQLFYLFYYFFFIIIKYLNFVTRIFSITRRIVKNKTRPLQMQGPFMCFIVLFSFWSIYTCCSINCFTARECYSNIRNFFASFKFSFNIIHRCTVSIPSARTILTRTTK